MIDQPYEIPNDWRWVRLQEVCGGFQYGYTEKATFEKVGSRFIRITDIRNGVINDETAPYCKISDNEYLKYKINKGDILIARMGSVGENGLATHDIDGVFASYLIRLVPKILPEFIRDYLQSDLYWNQIMDKSQGTTRLNVNANILKNLTFPLPPLDEQQRIVDIIESLFAKLDKAKTLAQNIIDNYELRRSAILHKAFKGQLTNSNLDNWQKVNLSTVCEINPPKISTKNLPDKLEVTFLPMTSISAELGKIIEQQRQPLIKVKKGFTNFSEGDVIFAKITPCMENGKSAIIGKLINDIGYGSTEFYVLRCSEKLYNIFLYHLIRSQKFRDEAKSVMAGAVGQQRVPKNFLEKYLLNLPTIGEQKEIVRILDSLLAKEQRTKELAEQTLQKIDLMRKAILARAFRGKL